MNGLEMMPTYMNCSLANLLLLLTVCTCLAMPTWIKVHDQKRMMNKDNGGFNKVGIARDEFKDKIPFRLSDVSKVTGKTNECCNLQLCTKCG